MFHQLQCKKNIEKSPLITALCIIMSMPVKERVKHWLTVSFGKYSNDELQFGIYENISYKFTPRLNVMKNAIIYDVDIFPSPELDDLELDLDIFDFDSHNGTSGKLHTDLSFWKYIKKLDRNNSKLYEINLRSSDKGVFYWQTNNEVEPSFLSDYERRYDYIRMRHW